MHSDLDILGVLNPVKYPPFPPTVKSMRGTHRSAERLCPELVEGSRRSLRFDTSALIITGVSTGEER